MRYGRAFVPDIHELIQQRNFKGLHEAMLEFAPADAADILSNSTPEDRAIVFRLLPKSLAADIFEYLNRDDQVLLLKALGKEDVAGVLNEMTPDDRTALLEELPGAICRELIDLLTLEERRTANQLLGYPEGSVGRRMTPDYVRIEERWTVGQVMEHLRRIGNDSETLNILYITDAEGKLLDDVRLRQLVLAPTEKRVAELMDRHFVALQATEDQEEAVNAFQRYDRVALPVVDRQGILLGIVTVDDVLEVAAREATEDIHKLGGLEALDAPYFETGLLRLVRKRALWLSALFLGEMLTATAMGHFEAEIAHAVVLALFIPLVISSGGNSGSQAATLIIRALALGEVRLRDWWRVMHREIVSGFLLGAILGAIGFLRIVIAAQFTSIYGPHWLRVAVTVAAALIGVVLWGTLAGSMLPFLLKRLGRDPAVSSAPFVATLVDVTGLVIYFSVALLILRGTLL